MTPQARTGEPVIPRSGVRAGFIVAVRGRISLADRDGLARVACECYAVIRAAAPNYD